MTQAPLCAGSGHCPGAEQQWVNEPDIDPSPHGAQILVGGDREAQVASE